jgi:hypothetical protein
MDGKINDKEFERFLKENADNHRLYPSDQVWNAIHAKLHTRKRWLAAGLSLLFLTGLTVTVVMLMNPGGTPSNSLAKQNKQSAGAIQTEKATSADAQTEETISVPLPLQNNSSQKIRIASPDNQHDNYFMATHLYEQTSSEPLLAQQSTPDAHKGSAQKLEKTLEATPQKERLMASSKIKPATTPTVMEVPPPVAVSADNTPEKSEEQKETLVDIRWMEDSYPLTIESVTNSYERQKHSPRFRWQLHFTPTISYRSLKEDQKFITQARMNLSNMPAAATPDLDNVITHRPDLGMQLGISGTYPLGKRIDFITGLQFNVSKYDIKAFNYPTEVATIALVNSWGGPTAVSTVTSFRSNGFNNRANWLRNYYYSISMPIGFEWRVLGKKHNHWGISATAQPTYVVGNRSYIISMDYQNYAEVPYLIRKWNLNLGFETYFKFNIGKKDFRIGPQIRYQALSSFKKGYPMQEHLYDMGIKLGMQFGK